MRSVHNLNSWIKILLSFFLLLLSLEVLADKIGQLGNRWGIVFIHRTTENPYNLGTRRLNHDILPLIYFEYNRFYIHGLDLGYQFYEINDWSDLKIVSKYRYFDLPKASRKRRDDGVNVGLEYHRELNSHWSLFLDFLSDLNGYPVGEVKSVWMLQTWKFYWEAYLGFLLKSSRYNRRYYGLDEKDPGADIDTNLGVSLKLNLFKNLYVLTSGEVQYFGKKTLRNSEVITPVQEKYSLGGGLMDTETRPAELKSKHFLRYGLGFATPANTNDILYRWKSRPDTYHNKLVSLFYGIPVSDDVLSLPISVYFQPGMALHLKNKDRQAYFPEYIALVKLVYTIPLPVRIRLGLGEGLSYSTQISDIEQREMNELKIEPSKLLNYLDYSLDISLHDIIRMDFSQNLWIGWYLHHRSGIYTTSVLFNRVRGGSNYNTFYIQYEF